MRQMNSKIMTSDPQRTVVEAYPGVLARSLIGNRPYKTDTKSKQTQEQLIARKDILSSGFIFALYLPLIDNCSLYWFN
jgi:hypothetical protein